MPPPPLRLAGTHVHIAGQGPPVLLVHSINAAAGAHEMRPLVEHLRATHTVYTPDLPGFGASERTDVAYSPRLYTDALHAVVAAIQRRHGAQPLPALALSLGCEFLARAAAEKPEALSRLALVSPTGLMGTQPRRGPPGATRAVPGLHRVLSNPLWAAALFRGLTKPGVVRYFLQRTWGGKAIDEAMWADAVATARAPGAHHAPLYFLGGGLFSADVLSLYEALKQPVWASHGTRGDFTDYRGRVFLDGRPNWRFTVYEGGALPYFEHPQAFTTDLQAFLAK
jgi:pimeloyl-ACP methyl ester carboxylesterase